MTKVIEVPASSTINDLQIKAKKYIKFSNNITAIDVASTLDENEIDRSMLAKFTIGTNVKELLPSCFVNCLNLETVTAKGQLSSVGDYAFYGCTRLSSISMLNNGNIPPNIGNFAFSQCAVQKIKIEISNKSSTAAMLGYSIFSNCTQLREVSFAGQNALAAYMFDGCAALSSVTLSRTSNRIEPYVFRNCTALKSLRMPADTFAVPHGFASKCTSLTSFSIMEPGKLGNDRSIGDYVLSDTALTSLTFPRSLTSFNAFSTNSLAGMHSLQEIKFNGITYEQIASETQQQIDDSDNPDIPSPPPQDETVQIKYATDKIYYESSMEAVMSWAGITDRSIYIQKSADAICQIINDCINNNIPIAAFCSGNEFSNGVPTCTHCQMFAKSIMKSQAFADFVRNNKKCVLIYGSNFASSHSVGSSGRSTFYNLCGLSNGGTYIIFLKYWKKPDGTVKKSNASNFQNGYSSSAAEWVTKKLIPDINKFAGEFNAATVSTGITASSTVTVTKLNENILNTNCFGLGHNVKLISNDGRSVVFEAGINAGSLLFQQTVQVDNITVDDFRYGQWYGQAKQLKTYADKNYIPVLAIAAKGNSSRESQLFNENVFNDSAFQNFINSKSILLCKIDAVSYAKGNASFLLGKWMKKFSFRHLPLMMMYWLEKDSAVKIVPDEGEQPLEYFDSVNDNFAYFSSNAQASQIDDVVCIHSSSEAIEWINSLTAYTRYVPQAKFQRPAIQSYLSRYPRYKMYANQLDDDYGRYFPVLHLKNAAQSSYSVNVNSSNGIPAQYVISYQNQSGMLPPDGTYQYFSMPYNNSNQGEYESIYQLSGLMFKIGQPISQQILQNDSYEYSDETEDAYFEEIGITTADIEDSTSSFFDDLYLDDGNDDPTTEIDPSMSTKMPFLWNVKKTIWLKDGVTVNSQQVNFISMWLSSEAQLEIEHEIDDDGDEYDVTYIVPGDTQYVVSAEVIGEYHGISRLLWIKEFFNSNEI